MVDTRNPYESPVADLSVRTATTEELYTPVMLQALKDTKPWIRFLSILGLVGTGLAGLAGIVMMIVGAVSSELGGGMGALMGILYLVIGALYIVPSLQLHKYGNAIARAALGGGTSAVEDALLCQKNFWRTVGIMMLVVIGLYIVAILGVVAYGIISALG
ncbi:MAG: hypothetical protein A2289_17805 [Deltaproteobacteria bacterium RIFOXYA12_FULL_58_15]|nr:MAG: hypothetical protein A2289_17805 [Deltaproteobacteria bacterium RIFOXYA12_FULL_58_15]OGR14568.1 MAG: hypothetical protein A2341_04905 [Deltaproteobacteria bacterium RIFOXYB12_FULL_58_9]